MPTLIKAGDILLFRVTSGSGCLGKLIGAGQKWMGQAPTTVEYEHVAIASSATTILEAYWPKIRERVFDPSQYPNLEVYSVQGASRDQITKVIQHTRSRIGELYNVAGILTLGFVQLGHSAVCSQLVWEEFTQAMILLCPYATLITPDDIAASPLLVRVP